MVGSHGMHLHFTCSESRVIGGGAGKNDDLQAAGGGQVEHALERLNAFGIGIGEGVVEEYG